MLKQQPFTFLVLRLYGTAQTQHYFQANSAFFLQLQKVHALHLVFRFCGSPIDIFKAISRLKYRVLHVFKKMSATNKSTIYIL